MRREAREQYWERGGKQRHPDNGSNHNVIYGMAELLQAQAVKVGQE